jgi:hypothetical protein
MRRSTPITHDDAGRGHLAYHEEGFWAGWAWREKPQCEFDRRAECLTDIPEVYDLSPEIALLERYAHWASYLGIETHIPTLIAAMRELPRLVRAAAGHAVRVIPTSG